jgi:hypothetical protein
MHNTMLKNLAKTGKDAAVGPTKDPPGTHNSDPGKFSPQSTGLLACAFHCNFFDVPKWPPVPKTLPFNSPELDTYSTQCTAWMKRIYSVGRLCASNGCVECECGPYVSYCQAYHAQPQFPPVPTPSPAPTAVPTPVPTPALTLAPVLTPGPHSQSSASSH